jgi:DNA-binding CsgD family transcriptional regulator
MGTTAPELRVRYALMLAEALVQPGHGEKGIAAIEVARDSLDGSHPELELELTLFDAGAGVDGGGGWVAGQALGGLIIIEEHDRALAFAAELEAEARRTRAMLGVLVATLFRGWAHAKRGELVMAESLLRTALEVGQSRGLAMIVTTGVLFIDDPLLERPSLDDVGMLVESIELDPSFVATWSGAVVQFIRAKRRRTAGRLGEAAADLRACGETADALGYGPAIVPWRSELALVLTAEDPAQARALVAHDLASARESGLARPVGVALRVSGAVADPEEQLDLLRESVRVLEGAPAPLERARSLVELGSALRERGHRTEARAPLLEALDLAHRCGADRLTTRAQEELRAAGARPRRMARTGAAALTPSEQRVAWLVAEGRTNPEVAQALFVSLKTVETHLSHVYAKLGVSGVGARRRLAEALETDRGPG